jgi:hypothetical protein
MALKRVQAFGKSMEGDQRERVFCGEAAEPRGTRSVDPAGAMVLSTGLPIHPSVPSDHDWESGHFLTLNEHCDWSDNDGRLAAELSLFAFPKSLATLVPHTPTLDFVQERGYYSAQQRRRKRQRTLKKRRPATTTTSLYKIGPPPPQSPPTLLSFIPTTTTV